MNPLLAHALALHLTSLTEIGDEEQDQEQDFQTTNPLETMPTIFDHEKLTVYQRALEFIEWVSPLLDDLPKSLAVQSQLDRASTSVVLNIAEGNGKFGPADRFKFFDIARGSAVECAACLDVLVRKKKTAASQAVKGKELLHEVVSMLMGLLKRNGQGRLKRAQDAA